MESLGRRYRNAGYADTHFPCKLWESGSNGLTLSKFEWDRDSKIMMYGQWDMKYGETLTTKVK